MTNATVKTTNDYKNITLPSGLKAQVLIKLKGKQQRLAGRMASAEVGDNDLSADPMAVGFSLIAVCAKVDGRALTIEDIEDMELEDINALQEAMTPKKKKKA